MKRAFILLLFAILCLNALAKRHCRRLTPFQKIKKVCYVGGCSSQLCTEDPGIMSTCEWRDEYACYREATCELQSNGQCGWKSTPELQNCLANPLGEPLHLALPVSGQCFVGGCSGQLCIEDPNIVSTCEWRDEYACYRDARCERQSDGRCGWTSTPELRKCLTNPLSEPEPCYIGGCSSQLCTDQPDAISTCEWTDSYACYGSATCERQVDGQCGWTSTPELKECLANPLGQSTKKCYVDDCSGSLCTENPIVMSTCGWRDEYACYKSTRCEVQTNGFCGWTSTPEFQQCLANIGDPTPVTGECFVGGCSGQLCTEDPNAVSTCEWKDEYACYKNATCERQLNGKCDWTSTPELTQCLIKPPPQPGLCYIGGCSRQLCTDQPDTISTCEWIDLYACYASATCERQTNGQCGWTSTPELQECLAGPPGVVGQCYVGGCSSQLCTEDPNIASTCEWREEYACYTNATCELQSTGQCGWTSTPELDKCLANPIGQPTDLDCFVGGCSGQLCTNDSYAISDCDWREEYACYKSATCQRQADGQCGWTRTSELEGCLVNPTGVSSGKCYVGGCSSQLCTEDLNIMSTCEWRDEYACYRDATCERQSNGQCGWTSTPEYEQCLANTLIAVQVQSVSLDSGNV